MTGLIVKSINRHGSVVVNQEQEVSSAQVIKSTGEHCWCLWHYDIHWLHLVMICLMYFIMTGDSDNLSMTNTDTDTLYI